jgi:HAMP domain-containing protein
MDHPPASAAPDLPDVSLVHGVGFRVLAWVVALFIATLAVFVGLDALHESRMLLALGATPVEIARFRWETLQIHAIHGLVSIVAFTLAIFVVVRQLLTRRIQAILRAINQFRHGTWLIRLPQHAHDEIECLNEAFRQLGPHLDRAFTTFVECDRKATVARLGGAYDKALSPLTRHLLALGATARSRGDGLGPEIERTAARMLAVLGSLGQPGHPDVARILEPFGARARAAFTSSDDRPAARIETLAGSRRDDATDPGFASTGDRDEPQLAF